MTALEVLEISQQALIVLFKIGMPIMVVALLSGLLISFIQALTQIQEMTLAFVPKILATFAVLFFAMPKLCGSLAQFSQDIFAKIEKHPHM